MRDEFCLEPAFLLLVLCSDFADLEVALEGEADEDFRLEVLADGRRFSLESVFFFFGDDDFPKRLGRTIERVCETLQT